jgi:hypothetical protein
LVHHKAFWDELEETRGLSPPKARLPQGWCLIDFNSIPNLPPLISQRYAYLVRSSGRLAVLPIPLVVTPRNDIYGGVGALRFLYAKS